MKEAEGSLRLCGGFLLFVLLMESCEGLVYSSRMMHRFSDEAMGIWAEKHGAPPSAWPRKGSAEYYGLLREHDIRRRGLLAEYQSLYFSQGNETVQFGETFGWLHYTWVDIGTPNVSFLVALDTGTDLFWVPCDCIQCAPTSASHYGLDRDLSTYSPEDSSTSKHLSCSSSFCKLSSNCKTKRQACPYIVQYVTDNTSTSGSLVEDVLYLASGDELAFGRSVKTPVVIGCGRIQSGGLLTGGAPDGLLGLGFSDISVPSLLAKAGLVQDSFSMCFQSDDSGRIFFGDTGASDQQTTPFLTVNGLRQTYFIEVEGIHVGSEALKISSFQTSIDSGTSFTYLPTDVYKHVTTEFDKQVNYPKEIYNVPWHYCYRVRSSDLPVVPSVSFTFKGGGNFSVYNPVMPIYTLNGTLDGFCLAMEEGPFGTIGQNYMTSYRLVFDRENMRLGWSPSDCYQLEENDGNMAPAPSPQNAGNSRTPLQQQLASPAHAVSPAIAGRTPQIQRSDCVQTQSYSVSSMLFCFAIVAILVSRIGHGGTWSY